MKVFAHRGASASYAEHTRAAFAHALALGVDGIETDVQLSADGHLICWHDVTLERTSSGAGAVRAHRLADLQKLDVHSWKTSQAGQVAHLPPAYTSPAGQLVTLDQLTGMMVDAAYPVELALEMKIEEPRDGAIETAVLAWLQRWGWNAATGMLQPSGEQTDVSVSIMSFSTQALQRLSTAVPEKRLCLLFDGALPTRRLGNIAGPSARWLKNPETIRTWVDRGHTVRMWTITTHEQLHLAQRLGVQQVTVDDPRWALQNIRAVAGV